MDTDLARTQMLTQQIRAWDVSDPTVLDVLADVPRDAFVPERYKRLAFADSDIPIGHGQVMLPPKIHGRMLQALSIAPGESVLEIGTGAGYLTACMASLAGRVTSIDIFPEMIDGARSNLTDLGIVDADLQTGDVFEFQPSASFDAIAVTGSTADPVSQFESWLNPGGRLFIVVGEQPVMEAILVTRLESGELSRTSLFETVIPPLINAPVESPFEF